MRNFTTLAMIGLLAACKPAAEKPKAGDDSIPRAVPEAKNDGPNAATTAVSLDGEGLRFVDMTSGKTSLLAFGAPRAQTETALRSEEHTSELQSLMRISYAVFCLKKKKN